ncbi:MAG: ABC transporter substrate-binding protein [Lachnospiraceae bacterium]|nr:ABC transporter substrate-binding protein [Lachnospiraceae bacterium]
MNKSLHITLIILITAVVLTGCGKDKSGDSEDITELRWVTYDTGNTHLDAREIIEAANEVSKEKIGVTVDLEFQSLEKINLMMASGEYYDMVFTSSWINPYDKNASLGLYYDITDLVKEETPILYDSIGKYWECAKVNGRVYAVPVLKDMGAEDMFRLNSDYFEKEKGMVIPERMEFSDIEPFLKAYKEDNPEKYPLAMDKSGLPGYINFLERVVDPIIVIPYDQGEDVQAIPFWECKELMDRYRLLHKWYQAGYIHPDAATIESTVADKSFPVRGGVAWKGYQGYSNPADWGFNVKTSIYDGPYLSRTSEQGSMIGICAACDRERATACLKYIELLSTDRRFRDILGYGVEGKHFEYLDNGTVYRLPAGTDRYLTRLYQTGSVVNASVETTDLNLPADPDQWKDVFEEYDNNGIYSKATGFAYDPGAKEDIITTLTAIYSDYAAELCTGTSDPDTVIPKIRERMEKAGINEVIIDINNQLDKWKKEQK